MNRFERCEDSIQRAKILITITPLPPKIFGISVKTETMKAIVLNSSLESRALQLETLIHEKEHLEHCWMYSFCDCQCKKQRLERKTKIASIKELVPEKWLINAIYIRHLSPCEICEELEIETGCLAQAIEWYSNDEDFIKARLSCEEDPFL